MIGTPNPSRRAHRIARIEAWNNLAAYKRHVSSHWSRAILTVTMPTTEDHQRTGKVTATVGGNIKRKTHSKPTRTHAHNARTHARQTALTMFHQLPQASSI